MTGTYYVSIEWPRVFMNRPKKTCVSLHLPLQFPCLRREVWMWGGKLFVPKEGRQNSIWRESFFQAKRDISCMYHLEKRRLYFQWHGLFGLNLNLLSRTENKKPYIFSRTLNRWKVLSCHVDRAAFSDTVFRRISNQTFRFGWCALDRPDASVTSVGKMTQTVKHTCNISPIILAQVNNRQDMRLEWVTKTNPLRPGRNN